ncbi:MAG: transketolase C-terminal domain-containing protein [Candidatus Saccharimonadales bacterium]
MIDLHLIQNVRASDLKKEANRKGFGRGLATAGEKDSRIVAACADLTGSTAINVFAEKFPDRFIEIGVAEQNLVTVGAGLAAMGKIPFVSSYAAFCPGRCWEQIRTTICLNERPVKIIGAHAGLSVGLDGATHQMLEDIALMRSLPHMVVIVPGDSLEAEKATLAMAADDVNPGYLRLAREDVPILTTDKTPFEIGKAYVYREGKDITLLSTGLMTYHAMVAAEILAKDGIDAEVVHVPTIKPLDEKTILTSLRKTGRAITIEEGQIAAGFGSAVAELASEQHPVPIRRMGMRDHFGESGKPDELFEHFGLTATHIAMNAHELLEAKK